MKRLTLIALAVASLASAPALAVSTATSSATLSDLSVSLFSLVGGSTSITFFSSGSGSDNYGYANASRSDGVNYWGDSGQFGEFSTGPWDPGSISASVVNASASASLRGPGTLGGTTLAADGSASSSDTYLGCTWSNCPVPYGSFNASVTAPYNNLNFVLSPKTVAVFGATAVVSASAAGGGVIQGLDYWNNPYTNYYGNYAYAQARLNVWGPAPGGGSGSQNADNARYASGISYYDGTNWVETPGADNGSLGVSFVNLTDAEMIGNFQASMFAYGSAQGDTLPVPEPGTYALMLAGLAAVGSLVRRRAKS